MSAKKSGDRNRVVRVGERVREEMASMMMRGFDDPRLQGVSITNVVMSPDLQIAKIYVRFDGCDDTQKRKPVLKSLGGAWASMRGEIGRRIGLRFAPRLDFYVDESFEKRQRIDELLNEIAREPKGDGGADGS